MKLLKILFTLAFVVAVNLLSGQSFKLSGVVKDNRSGEALFGVSIKVLDTDRVINADFDGGFSVDLPEGDYTVKFIVLGYKEKVVPVSLNSDVNITVPLESDSYELDEVVITLEAEDENITSVEIGVQELDIEEIKKVPPFLGEVDVVKSLELLPGITTTGEGSSGFNVRGGTIDQNLILSDYAPIYSSSHLLGFFSVFNSDVIKSVKIYKGGIPAEYGGRISSVLDVRQTSGNRDSAVVKGGIGVVSGRLMASAPIDGGKGSVLIAARRSWADLFLKLSSDEQQQNTRVYFYDLNTKISYDLGDEDAISFTGYYGRDVFAYANDFQFDWGNLSTSLVWNHAYGDKLIQNTSAFYTRYSYEVGSDPVFNVRSDINNTGLNIDYEYLLHEKHKIKFGLQNTYYDILPGGITGEALNDSTLDRQYGLEVNPYLADEFKISDKVTILAGLRYSNYFNFGRDQISIYPNNQPKNEGTETIVEQYDSGELIQYYGGFEPRLAMNYSLDSSSSIKLGYNRTRQYIHLISNTSNGLPIDAWKISSKNIKPVVSDQVSMGYFRNFKDNAYETSAEVYYKYMDDILDYRYGADLIFSNNIEREVIAGEGRSYGLELYFKKVKGKLTGWLSYTLSQTQRKTNSQFVDEAINNNEWYSANYDKRHDVSLVLSYEMSERVSLSGAFLYATGRPISIPDSKFEYEGVSSPSVSTRNSTRMPAYHRLDLSCTLYSKNYKNRKFRHYWVFSVYNLYGRKNPYSYSFDTAEDDATKSQVTQLSILGTILPAFSFNFEF
jgi:hypothetical protein